MNVGSPLRNMIDPGIDERLQEAQRLVRESESLVNHLTSSSEIYQLSLDQLRINLENLQKIKAEIIASTLDS